MAFPFFRSHPGCVDRRPRTRTPWPDAVRRLIRSAPKDVSRHPGSAEAQPPGTRRQPVFEPLEPRYLLSADLLPLAVDMEDVAAGGGSELHLRFDALTETCQILDERASSEPIAQGVPDPAAPLRISGTGGDDTLVVDFSPALSFPAGVVFEGGGGADTLVLTGDPAGHLHYGSASATSGFIDLGEGAALRLTFDGVEAVDDRLKASERRFVDTSNEGRTIALAGGSGERLTLTLTGAGGDGFRVTFASDGAAIDVDAGAGDDTLIFGEGLASSDRDVIVRGGAGADTLQGPRGSGNAVRWLINGEDAGEVLGLRFADFETLAGAADNQDTFVIAAGARVSGSVDGGAGGFDSLELVGGEATSVAYTFTGPDSGLITIDGETIAFAGLEPIADGNMSANRTYDVASGPPGASNAGDIIRLSDQGGGAMLLQSLNTPPTFEQVQFATPATSLTIDAGPGNDTIILDGIAPGFAPALTITGGAGDDVLVVNTNQNVTLSDAQLRIGALVVTLNGIDAAIIGSPSVSAGSFSGPVATGLPDWTSQGPGPISGGQVAGLPGSPVTGAIEAIAAHPTDANIVFVATIGGGIWRTRNALQGGDGIDNDGDGQIDELDEVRWEALTDQFPSLAITSIEFDPANPDILYASTGKASSSDLGGRAVGVLKSVNGGDTWSLIRSSVFEGRTIHRVLPTSIVDGAGNSVVLVAMESTAWGNPLTQYGGGLLRSTNSGQTWFKISGNQNDTLNQGGGATDNAAEATGLPAGTVTDIEGEAGAGANPQRFYAAMPGQWLSLPFSQTSDRNDVDPVTDRITITNHGLAGITGPFQLSAVDPAATLPGGLVAGTLYWLRPVNNNTVALRAAPGGADLAIGPGSGVGDFRFTRVYSFVPADVSTSAAAQPNRISLAGHGLNGLSGPFRISASVGGALPGGLAANTAYYLSVVDANTVQVQTSLGGPVIPLTSQGMGTLQFTPISGVFTSADGGQTWMAASNGIPNIEQTVRIELAVSETVDVVTGNRPVYAARPWSTRPASIRSPAPPGSARKSSSPFTGPTTSVPPGRRCRSRAQPSRAGSSASIPAARPTATSPSSRTSSTPASSTSAATARRGRWPPTRSAPPTGPAGCSGVMPTSPTPDRAASGWRSPTAAPRGPAPTPIPASWCSTPAATSSRRTTAAFSS